MGEAHEAVLRQIKDDMTEAKRLEADGQLWEASKKWFEVGKLARSGTGEVEDVVFTALGEGSRLWAEAYEEAERQRTPYQPPYTWDNLPGWVYVVGLVVLVWLLHQLITGDLPCSQFSPDC